MRRILVILTLSLGAAVEARAQSWNTEVGVQGGYTRIKPAGTHRSDHVDLVGLPGDFSGVLPSNASLFVILPATRTLAFETSLSALHSNKFALIGDATFVTIGARANYAITSGLYAAAGGTLQWFHNSGQGDTQLGLQTGLGYRFPVIARLRGRVEANALLVERTSRRSPSDIYALTFGFSTDAGRRQRRASTETSRAWEPMVGLQGGYSFSNVAGGTDVSSFALPVVGSAFTLLGTPATPPTLFVVVPVHNRIALEPGVDFHRIQSQGLTLFDANMSLRVDYALIQNVYAGLGGNLVYLKGSGFKAQTIQGANLAAGYRIPLTTGLGARFELSYAMMRKNESVPFPAVNTVSLLGGVTLRVQ